jgi:hypothetical protein
MRARTVAAVGAVLVATACGPADPAPAAKAVPAAPTPAPVAESELDAAFRAAFGGPPPVRRLVARGEWGDADLAYRPARLIPLTGGVLALVSDAETEPCRACFGALAVHYLRRDAGGFRVLGAWPALLNGSSFGAPPRWTRRDDLFAGPALEAVAGGAVQGCAVERVALVELTPERPLVRAEGVLTAYDGPEGVLRGAIRPGVRGRDFLAGYPGLSVRYALSGARYVPVGREPRLPSC